LKTLTGCNNRKDQQMKLKNLKTLAQEQSLSIHTLRKFARMGMPHFRVGRKIFVDQHQFESWFASHFKENADSKNQDLAQIIEEAVAAVRG
jgi:hypothetical protein